MLNNSIKSLHPLLAAVYSLAAPRYAKAHPTGPRLGLNETSRSQAIQTAYYARGRQSVAEVQRLYKAAGLYAIGKAEAAIRNSNAQYGQSAHNFDPARGFDLRLTDAKGNYIGDEAAYRAVWAYIQAAAIELNTLVVWGGTWKDWPHVELRHWRTM